jgi:hypothetical protein
MGSLYRMVFRTILLLSLILAAPPVYAEAPKSCVTYLRSLLLGDSVQFEGKTLYVTNVSDLRPTQMAIGQFQVEKKKAALRKLLKDPKKLDAFLIRNPEPTVIGPGGKLYIIDHHHLGRALSELGVNKCYRVVVDDLSNLSEDDFWRTMLDKRWAYPYDGNGKGPYSVARLPASVSDLEDDPYRSLAGMVRRAGGFEKSAVPFAEFIWANFFRTRIKLKKGDKNFEKALFQAMKLAHSREAEALELPGYISE